jgi:cell division protein YceG involved in septum cleavage
MEMTRLISFPVWTVIVMLVGFVSLIVALFVADYRRFRTREEARKVETKLRAENGRLVQEISQLQYDPLTIQRNRIFRDIRDYDGP